MKKRSRTVLIGVGLATALGAGGVAFAGAGGDDDGSDRAITGPALDRASAAALEHTGGGRVTGTEAGDEESLYEVEVTRSDGSRVDVQIDRGFRVVGTEEEERGEE